MYIDSEEFKHGCTLEQILKKKKKYIYFFFFTDFMDDVVFPV